MEHMVDRISVLFVDDMPERHRLFRAKFSDTFDTAWAKNFDEAVDRMCDRSFDVIFLDHDLSVESVMCDPNDCREMTGSDIAKFLVDKRHMIERSALIIVHTLNPAGAENMVSILEGGGFGNVRRIDFLTLMSSTVKID